MFPFGKKYALMLGVATVLCAIVGVSGILLNIGALAAFAVHTLILLFATLLAIFGEQQPTSRF